MTEEETVDLLAFMAAFDQRTVGMADIEAWSRNRWVRRLSLEEAKDVVVAFHDQEPTGPGQDYRLTPQQFNRWARIVKDRHEHARTIELQKRMITRGTPDPRPANFRDMVAKAAADFAKEKQP